MRIAAITDDGTTISQHFGRAQHYLVATIENGRIVHREMRLKLSHAQFAGEPHAVEIPDHPHGTDPASHDKHLRMAQVIADCQVLLCRGMGRGAYESMQAIGIQPVVTNIILIDEAVIAYTKGDLIDHPECLH